MIALKDRTWLLIALSGFALIWGVYFIYFHETTGDLIVEFSDPPESWGPATNIYISFGSLAVHRADAGNESGWYEVVNYDWIDLTKVLNSSKNVGAQTLEPGKYNLIRFNVVNSIVTVDGENYTAYVNNGKLNIPITHGGIEVISGGASTLLVDITPKITGNKTDGFHIIPAAKATPLLEK